MPTLKCPDCKKPLKPLFMSGEIDDILETVIDAVSTSGVSLTPPQMRYICTNMVENKEGMAKWRKDIMKNTIVNGLKEAVGLQQKEPPPKKIPCKSHYKDVSKGK